MQPDKVPEVEKDEPSGHFPKQRFLRYIAEEAKDAGIEKVDENNAADLLAIIKEAGDVFIRFKFHPFPIFSTRETCDTFIKKHEWMLPTLKLVHERGVYAWFVESVIQQHPSVRDYIFPDEINFKDAIVPTINCREPKHCGSLECSDSSNQFSPRHLHRSYLPFNIILVEDLASRMKCQLQNLLEERYSSTLISAPSEKLKRYYESLQQHVSDLTEASRVWTHKDVYYFLGHFFWPAGELCLQLAQRRMAGGYSERYTNDGSTRLHRVINLDKYNGPTRIIIDEISVPTGRRLIPSIIDRAKQGTFSFDNDKNIEWKDEKATVARLCWKIMDRDDNVRWAMIFSGDIHLLFLVIIIMDEDQQRRPVMYCSNVMKVDDPTFTMSTVLLYMALNFPEDVSQSELLARLNIDPPPVPAKLPIPKKLTISEEGNRLAALKTASGVVLKLGSSEPVLMSRRYIDYSKKTTDEYIPIMLKEEPIIGGFGCVYQTDLGVRVKYRYRYGHGDGIPQAFDQELEVYRVLDEKSCDESRRWPRLFGCFCTYYDQVMIISDEGDALDSFFNLSEAARSEIYSALVELHKLGVEHGDFAPRNVVYGPRGYIIIDFTHAEYDHVCTGVESCRELMKVHKALWEPSDSLGNDPSNDPKFVT